MSRRKPSISPHRLAAIKSRVPMAALVAEDIPLQRAGREYVGLCAFHSERSPSFRLYPDGHGHCFGCGWHGLHSASSRQNSQPPSEYLQVKFSNAVTVLVEDLEHHPVFHRDVLQFEREVIDPLNPSDLPR